MKTISKEFNSNCLWEAVKAKLKDWKNVKILKLGKDINSNGIHYMWSNKSQNKIYHFRCIKKPHFPFYKIRFKGVIQEDDLDLFKKFIYESAAQINKSNFNKLVAKYNLTDLSNLMDRHFIEDGEFPNLEDAKLVKAVKNMVQVVRKVDNEVRITFVEAGEQIPEDCIFWQYVTREENHFYRIILGAEVY